MYRTQQLEYNFKRRPDSMGQFLWFLNIFLATTLDGRVLILSV